MFSDRSLGLARPATWEANVMPPASAVSVEVIRKNIRDVGIVAGPVVLSLTTSDPVLYPGVLAGTKTQQVRKGIAVFDGLSINVPGLYTLNASCENNKLQLTATSPTTGSLTLWRIYNLPITADPAHMGRWVNFTGTGLQAGIWGKIVDVGTHATLGQYWSVEQPTGTTSISVLSSYGGTVTVRYNAADPLVPPSSFFYAGMDAWLNWGSGSGGGNVASIILEATGQVLTAALPVTVLRNATVAFTSCPAAANTGETHGVQAAVLNANGTVASDLNGPNATLQLRSGVTVLSTASVPVVNGYISGTVTMPGTPGPYTVWITYQGTWYQAAQVTDNRSVTVAAAPAPEQPGTPPPPDAKFPEKKFSFQVAGCPVEFKQTCVLELGAPDTFIEVITK